MTELAVTCHMWILQLARNKQTLYMHQSVVKVLYKRVQNIKIKETRTYNSVVQNDRTSRDLSHVGLAAGGFITAAALIDSLTAGGDTV